MEKIIVSGHKNPDTDSVCSAIAMAKLQEGLGVETTPVRLGELSNETLFVLDYFKMEAPKLINNFKDEATHVILVDHNEFSQSADGINDVTILSVVDHHRIANFETSYPLYYRAEPVGCTCTILCKMYREKNIQIEKAVAGLMLSAIISDTLLFKSPTCTQEDKDNAIFLADIAEIDIESYGIQLLKAGASIEGKTAVELINIDSKPFTMGDLVVEVAQISVVDIDEVLEMKHELLHAMNEARVNKNQDIFFTIITDVLNNNSKGIISGDTSIIEEAFAKDVIDNVIDLPGVVSRKKQVVPVMTNTAQNR